MNKSWTSIKDSFWPEHRVRLEILEAVVILPLTVRLVTVKAESKRLS